MYNNKKILGLITARGGSKRVPKKNSRALCGRPLIAWTIDEAEKSAFIDRLIVSTDDEEIADVARDYGAEVPFLRPSALAADGTSTIEVILHVLNRVQGNDRPYDLLVLLQPTSPLRTWKDIDAAIELLFSKNAKSVVSVCEVDHHPYWANMLPDDGCMKDFLRPEWKDKDSRELPCFYRLNGAVFVVYADYIRKYRSFFGKETFAYIMPQERSVDIDSHIDFLFAEALLKQNSLLK